MKIKKTMFKSLVTVGLLIGLLAGQTVGAVSAFTEEQATISIIKALIPSTVSIVQYQEMDNLNLSNGEVVKKKTEVGEGTGFIVSADGLIVTNRHVVTVGTGDLKVFLADGRSYSAEVAAIDPIDDLALLKIVASKLPTVKLGDSDKIQIGATAIAIGNALGRYQNSATKGIISGLQRSLSASDSAGTRELLEDVIQTDAAINLGNSGGPLVNLRGEVMGINVAIETGAQSIGFAIPINSVKRIVESYKKFGKIRRAFLGVRYEMIDAGLKEEYGLDQNDGAFILANPQATTSAVVSGSAAEAAGLLEGDIILSVNNIQLNKTKSLRRALMDFWPGQKVTLKVNRNDQTFTQAVTLGEYPQQ